MLLGTDGGVYISHDRGHHWRFVETLPVSQFYHVSYDIDWPYNVYGGLQDNGSWTGPSRASGGVASRDWKNLGFGDGFYAFRDPADPDFVYVEYQGGNIGRVHLTTGEARDIKPQPRKGEPDYRFNWNTPIHLSPTQKGTVYIGSQFLFRSRDRGDSWERISPDLTTNDPAKQKQQRVRRLTRDNSTAENHTTIYSIAESPKDPQTIWAGTDDGNLQVTRDGGKTWTDVGANRAGAAEGDLGVARRGPAHDAATAYATFDGHARGDMKTYVFKTTDFGKSWQALATDAVTGYAHVVEEDPVNRDLLFLGTETGLFISVDGGARWVRFTGNFPDQVAVRDLVVHPRESDLIVATHGRGIYILDDITPLRQLTREVLEAEVAVLTARPTVAVIPSVGQRFGGDDEFVAFNPPEEATIVYYLKKRHLFGDLKVEVYDADGKLVTTLPGGKRKGINRVSWPMRAKPPKMPPANSLVLNNYAMLGPRVPLGAYTFKVVKGDQTYPGKVELVADPRSTHADADRKEQEKLVWRLYEMLGRLTYLADAVTDAKEQADKKKATKLAAEWEELRKGLVATSAGGWLSGEEQLREKLGLLYGAVNSYEGKPTQSQVELAEVLEGRLEAAYARAEELKKRGVVEWMTKEEWEKKKRLKKN